MRVGASISTDTAEVVLVAERIIAQHMRPSTACSKTSSARLRKAREQLASGVRCSLLLVFPPEYVVDPQLTNEDHFRKESIERRIVALAVVAKNTAVSAISKFYFRYYPQAFEARVFDTEVEAHHWLQEQLAAGSPS